MTENDQSIEQEIPAKGKTARRVAAAALAVVAVLFLADALIQSWYKSYHDGYRDGLGIGMNLSCAP